MRRCALSHCYVHEGQSCAEGELDPKRCQHWSPADAAPEPATPTPSTEGAGVPWSSSALGPDDLLLLTPRSRTIVVGVLGAHDAGKTTLLTAAYLHLLRGKSLANAHFAGSRTLGAWESLAAWTRFDDAARPPTFPPHTPRGTSRTPGLLHLALRGADEQHRDVLLTDAPGEWFAEWSRHEEAHGAAGARWIARHADVFLVFADSVKLQGQQRGTEREALRQLLERLGNHVGTRPTTLVWSKHEEAPPDGIRNAILATQQKCVPHAQTCAATVTDPGSLTRALESVLLSVWAPPAAHPVVPPVVDHRPFAAYRGNHERA
jgi:hypothetical protein